MAEAANDWVVPGASPAGANDWVMPGASNDDWVVPGAGQRQRAQPGSLSFAAQGPGALIESAVRMALGMAGQTAGGLGAGVAAIPDVMRGRGDVAAQGIRAGMEAGGEKLTPKRTIFAPTATFDEQLGHFFEGLREVMGQGMEGVERARGVVGERIHPALRARPEIARTLGEYAFDAPAAAAPLSLARGAVRRKPVTVEGKGARVEEPVPAMEPAFEGTTTPRTGTSSGVPIKLDRLIAGAERDWQLPEPPKPKQIVRQAAQEGLEARAPALGEEGPQAFIGRPGEVPSPPAPQAPRGEAAGQRAGAEPRDFFLEESTHQIDLPRSEVRGGEAYSGGANRRVFETVRFPGPFEQVLANAGRDWATPEAQAKANRELRNAVEQLPPDSPYASLRNMPYDQLELASKQYWREAREQLLEARRADPEAARVQVEAPPAERLTLYGEVERGLAPLPEPLARGAGRPEIAEPPKREVADPRLTDTEQQSILRDLGREAGWEEFGGKLIRDPMSGEAAGRTAWIGQEWYRAMQQIPELRSSPEGVRAVIEKAIAGDKLGAKQKRVLEYLLDEVQYRMEGEGPSRGGGSGTLSANPMFDPKRLGQTAEFLTNKPLEYVRSRTNSLQNVPESAKKSVPTMFKYAREVAFAKERGQRDSVEKNITPEFKRHVEQDYSRAVEDARQQNPKYAPETPKTLAEAIRQTELARREAAKMRMQRQLYQDGYVVKAREGADWKEFRQPTNNLRDLRGPDGALLRVRNDAFDAVNQVVTAHDVARQRQYQKTWMGAAEGISHGVVSWLMWNPLFHGLTTGGKGVIYSLPGKDRGSIVSYGKEAVESLKDRAKFEDMMKHGMQPFGLRAKMEPLGSVPGTVESGLKQLGLEKPYEFYQWVHKNILADIVNTIQAAFYHMRLDQQLKQAERRGEKVTTEKMDVFKTAAAEESNLIGGNLPREQLQEGVYRALGATLFSRGLTVSTLRMLTRAFENNRIIEAYARGKGFTPAEAQAIMKRNRDFMTVSLVMDYIALQAVSNAVNWVTTEMNQEPGGIEGGHFVWENQGSDKSQKWLPTNVFLYPEGGKEDEKTGRGVYASAPIRVARDIVEWVEGVFQVATGQAPKILKNKMGAIPETLIETLQGEDWAGRPLGGTLDAATNLVAKVAPQPFGDIPWAAAEAMKSGNFGFLAAAIEKSFDADTGIPILLGMQPKIAANDPTTIKFATEQSKEERKLWGRVGRVKQMARGMDSEVREAEIESILSEARRIGMTAQRIGQISRVMHAEGPSKSQRRAAQTYQRVQEGEIPPPPNE